MRTIVGVLLLIFFTQSADKAPMVQPKVTHHDRVTEQHYDDVEVTCPDGTEGHFVDIQVGFGPKMGMSLSGWEGNGEAAYTVCFDKKFMDKVRANPDLARYRPILKPA